MPFSALFCCAYNVNFIWILIKTLDEFFKLDNCYLLFGAKFDIMGEILM